MSGFHTSRFVGLTEFQKTFMSCGICTRIMNKPVETQCRHTFCKSCIENWILLVKTCPECNKKLGKKRKNNSQVKYHFETSKKYNDMFNVLQIKCNFKGCEQIVELGSLDRHIEDCIHNKCDACELQMGKTSEHNCIELLKKFWKNLYEKCYEMNDKNIGLTKSLAEERAQVLEIENQLKVENNKYKQLENEMKTKSYHKDLIELNNRLKTIEKDLTEKTELISIKDLEIKELITDNKDLKKINAILKAEKYPKKSFMNGIKEIKEENMDSKQLNVEFINGLVEKNNSHSGECSETQLESNQRQNESKSKAKTRGGDNTIADLIETNEDLPQLFETLQEKLIEKDIQIKQLLENDENGGKYYRERVKALELENENMKKLILEISDNS